MHTSHFSFRSMTVRTTAIALLALIVALFATGANSHSASAQTYYSNSPITTTVPVNLSAGGNLNVSMPDGTVITLVFPNGVAAGTIIDVTVTNAPQAAVPVYVSAPAVQYSSYVAPPVVYNTGGQCVNGSFPSVYGCTASYVPVVVPFNNYNTGCNALDSFSCGNFGFNGGCGFGGFACGNGGVFPHFPHFPHTGHGDHDGDEHVAPPPPPPGTHHHP